MLDKLVELAGYSVDYKDDPDQRRYNRPDGAGFSRRVRLGGDDDSAISTLDADGVTFAAIQGLNQKLEQQIKSEGYRNRGSQNPAARLRN